MNNDHASQIRGEQATLLYGQANTGFIATLLISLVLVIIFWDIVPHPSLLGWLFSLYAITFLRLLQVVRFKRSVVEPHDAQSWINHFVLSIFISGAVWGSSVIVIFPENSIAHQVFLVFALGGMAAGAVAAFSTVMTAFLAFTIPALLPAIVSFFLHGGDIGGAMGFMLTVFLVLIIATARRVHKNIIDLIELRFEKTEILASLKSAKEKAETKSEELECEIERKDVAERELKKAKEAAENATRLKDKFVTLVAHDLKSPLSSVTELLKLIESDKDSLLNQWYKDLIEKVLDSCQNMLKMIDELLNVTRLQTGNIRPETSFFDGNNLVQAVIGTLMALADKKEIDVQNDVPQKTRLFADPMLFEQVLQNLLSNAIKFCEKGDRITVFVPDDEPATIAVRDTGTGMSDRMQKVVFSYEEKTSTMGTAGELGTGLGLPLSRDIMNVHGGSLFFESEKEKGSTFFARLPHVKPTILIVDDDLSARNLAKLRLKDLGAEYREAENGREAIEKIEKEMPHLILLDLRMPVMDGYEFLSLVRSQPDKISIPIIVITSELEVEVREKVFRLGANDFVKKPVESNDLIPRVRRFIV